MGILLGQCWVHRILREVHHGLCLVRSVNIYCDRECISLICRAIDWQFFPILCCFIIANQ